MIANTTFTRRSKLVFALSIIVVLFWVITNMMPVYRYVVLGAIYELLWLPMIALIFTMPVFSFISWLKEKFVFKSLYLASFVLTGMALVCFFVFIG